MIEIKCAADNAPLFAARCGAAADTAWEMTERGNTLGFSLAIYEEDGSASLTWLEAPDAPLTDALFRATLNALSAQGVRQVRLKNEALCAFAVKKGYVADGGLVCIEIREFFSKSACKG